MKRLKLWMRIIGGFYIFLGVINSPPVVAARMSFQYPALDLELDHLAVILSGWLFLRQAEYSSSIKTATSSWQTR